MGLVLLASVYTGEIEAQRSEVTCLRSHSYERLNQDLNPGLSDSSVHALHHCLGLPHCHCSGQCCREPVLGQRVDWRTGPPVCLMELVSTEKAE